MQFICALVVVNNGRVEAKPFIIQTDTKRKAEEEAHAENVRNFPNAELYLEVCQEHKAYYFMGESE